VLAAIAGQQLLAPAALLATGAATGTPTGSGQTLTAAQRRELWATIDVCNAPDQKPHTIGIRGSMPGTGEAHGEMYMRFRLQYLSSPGEKWVDLAAASESEFVAVGSAKGSRQGGATFTLKPVPSKTLTVRGVVTFQWRDGTTVSQTLSRPTTAGHRSLAGADPAGFSAATCPLS
jgi:hypothetical protein